MRTKTEIPAVVYGSGTDTLSLSVNYDEFVKLFKEAGESSLIDLVIGGKESGKVLVKDIQYDPITDRVRHLDLKRIDMTKPIVAMVVLRFVGEASVIKEQGGTLMRNIEKVEIKCLPKDLVGHIDVDLSNFKTYEDVIKIKDLKVPAGAEIINPHAEDLVAKVARALTDEEIKAMEGAAAPADLSQIEVAGKKKEEEGAVEGEADGEEKKSDSVKAAPAKEEKKAEKK